MVPTVPRSYVCVPRWPEDWDEPRRTDAIARATGLDVYSSRRLARLAPPSVLLRAEHAIARSAAHALRRDGVAAFALPHESLVATFDPPVALALTPRGTPHEYDALVGPGQTTTPLHLARAFLLVRGQARTTIRRVPDDPGPFRLLNTRVTSHGIPIPEPDAQRPTYRTEAVEFLDVHLAPSGCVRFESGRFDWCSLVADPAPGAKDNMDRLSLLLVSQAREAGADPVVDTGFARAGSIMPILTDFLRHDTPSEENNRHSPLAFGVYSAWISRLVRAEIESPA